MEKYKQKIKKRSMLYLMLFTILNVTLTFVSINRIPILEIDSMVKGFSSGLCVAFDFLLLYLSIRDRVIISSDEKLKKNYIKENDERKKYIRQFVGAPTTLIIYFVLVFATVISGFVNKIVFLTLIGVDIVIGLIITIMKCYYMRKF